MRVGKLMVTIIKILKVVVEIWKNKIIGWFGLYHLVGQQKKSEDLEANS